MYPASSECELIRKIAVQLVNLYTYLLHGVTVTNRNSLIILRIKIVGNAVRCSDFILPPVTLSDISSVIVIAVILPAKLRVNGFRRLRQLL